jgi:hypothetical protein
MTTDQQFEAFIATLPVIERPSDEHERRRLRAIWEERGCPATKN